MRKLFTVLLALVASIGMSWAETSTGALKGAFSVAGDKVVYFSKGNLQYNSGTQAWQFAENQYDYVGSAAGNTSVTADGIADNNGTVDLFGWVGASSIWTGLKQYGITSSTATFATDGYGDNDSEALKSDWGTTMGTGWFTLSTEQWQYLFNTRSGATVNGTANARYTEATINTDGTGVNGIILFPDDFDVSKTDGATTWGTINGGSDYETKLTTAQWNSFEEAGCVFLPAAGYRKGTSVKNAGSDGYYWSSSPDPSSIEYAYYVRFMSYSVDPDYNNRYYGYSVRLVTETAPVASDSANPIAVENGTKDGFSYTLYDNGLLEISGSGAMPNHAFVEEDFSADVKNIRFAKDCEVYSLGDMWFRCYDSKYSQLETVEINSVVPISFLGEGIFYKQESAVTITITAPGIVNVESEIVGNYYSPVNMIFNVPATTVFEKNWFLRNESYYAITIPTGATGHVPASLAFTDPDKQSQYDDAVEMGNEEWFWDMFGDGLTEGVDYNKVEESTFVITAENASQIFGPATVYFQDPEPEPQPQQGIVCTAEDLDKVLCSDGSIYENVAAATAAGKTAVAMIASINTTDNKVVALALADEAGTMDWETAKNTCAAKTAVAGVAWTALSLDQLFGILEAHNGGELGYYADLNTTIANVGGTSIPTQIEYWTKDEFNNLGICFHFDTEGMTAAGFVDRANTFSVRACLEFDLTVSGGGSEPEPAEDVNITPNEDPDHAGVYYSTFFDSENKYALPAGVEAYVATLDGANLLLSKIAVAGQTIPADNAVILKSSVDQFTLSISDAEAVPVNAINSLQGTDVSIDTPANCYVLAGNDGVGFYHYTASMLNPHKAYVIYSGTPNQAPHRMPFVFNQATGVENVQGNVQSTKVLENGVLYIMYKGTKYNVQGQEVK